MPIRPVSGGEPLPVEHPDHVGALVALLLRGDADPRYLGDHFAFLAGTRPEWFRPHQDAVLTTALDRFEVTFDDMCLLFGGASDRSVRHLARQLHDDPTRVHATALAAIGTAAALAAVADDVRAGGSRKAYEDLGVWVPPVGPARYRFSPHRRAVVLRAAGDRSPVDHPVGSPLHEVVRRPGEGPVSWHYVSLRVADVPGLPPWPADRVHLVGPRASCEWTVCSHVDGAGLHDGTSVVVEEPPAVEEQRALRAREHVGGGTGAVDLRPYDADLVYANGHVLSTPGVVGTAGGPPTGLYRNPSCPGCGRLMFHVATVTTHVREYGDGFRSLFLCEDCRTVACNATGWN